MARLNVPNILYKIALNRWELEGWKVRYHMRPNVKDARMLAQVSWDSKTVDVYPHPVGVPVEKTGLHELLHIGLDLDGNHEAEVYFLEEWIWKRLTTKQKQKLRDIFASHIDI